MAFDMDALTLEQKTAVRAALEALESEENDSEEEGKAPSAPPENSTIKAIRAEAKRAEKRAAAAEAEAAELRRFKEEAESERKQAALAAAGLTPRQAEVFLKASDEVTPEAIDAFKSEVLGVRAGSEDEGVPSAPFAPSGVVSEKPSEVISGRDAVREYVQKHGVEAATKAWQEGKIQF
jgi:hypothetical protein